MFKTKQVFYTTGERVGPGWKKNAHAKNQLAHTITSHFTQDTMHKHTKSGADTCTNTPRKRAQMQQTYRYIYILLHTTFPCIQEYVCTYGGRYPRAFSASPAQLREQSGLSLPLCRTILYLRAAYTQIDSLNAAVCIDHTLTHSNSWRQFAKTRAATFWLLKQFSLGVLCRAETLPKVP